MTNFAMTKLCDKNFAITNFAMTKLCDDKLKDKLQEGLFVKLK
jgi:hypothetical protein